MARPMRWTTALLIVIAAVAAAEDRLAVLEFFGRTGCGNCQAAGAVVADLQIETAGRALLLEYDVDDFLTGRLDRFVAAAGQPPYLPLVMVGSGYRTSDGVVNFEVEYQQMLDAELARPPQAEVSAHWRRVGNSVRAYVTARNQRATPLTASEDASVWLIVWELSPIGISNTWVYNATEEPIPGVLEPDETFATVIESPSIYGADWSRIHALALVEHRPGGSGRYDMLQAAEAVPADLAVEPDSVSMSSARREVELSLDGPHVLYWSASANVPWLDLSPSDGGLPATLTMTLLPEHRPADDWSATVTIDAEGDDMSFTVPVEVNLGGVMRRGQRQRMQPEAP